MTIIVLPFFLFFFFFVLILLFLCFRREQSTLCYFILFFFFSPYEKVTYEDWFNANLRKHHTIPCISGGQFNALLPSQLPSRLALARLESSTWKSFQMTSWTLQVELVDLVVDLDELNNWTASTFYNHVWYGVICWKQTGVTFSQTGIVTNRRWSLQTRGQHQPVRGKCHHLSWNFF